VQTGPTTMALTTLTSGGSTGGTTFQCNTSNNNCATNLATVCDLIANIDCTSVGAVVYIQPTAGSLVYDLHMLVSDVTVTGVFATATAQHSTDGKIYMPANVVVGSPTDSSSAYHGIYFDADGNTGWTNAGFNDRMYLFIGGVYYASFIGSSFNIDQNLGFITYGETIGNTVDGKITLASATDTNNENLIINLGEAAANQVNVESTTGVTLVDYQAIDVGTDKVVNASRQTSMVFDNPATDDWSLLYDATSSAIWFDDSAAKVIFGVPIQVPTYTREVYMPMTSATSGGTAPVSVTIGTLRCLQFDQARAGETAKMQWEVPDDWVAGTDIVVRIYGYAEAGDAIAAGEVVEWTINMRALDSGDAYDDGTVYSGASVYTQSGAGTDKGGFRTSLTIDDANAQQPLAVDRSVYFQIDLHEVNTTYSGNPYACKMAVRYSSNGIPTGI
jgi:hypothetical protein